MFEGRRLIDFKPLPESFVGPQTKHISQILIGISHINSV